jgi:hypothetical protein
LRSNTVLTVIFVVIVAAVLIGEAYVYTLDPGRYSSVAQDTADGRLEYAVTSGGSDVYSVVVLDNGAFEKIDKYYIYYDAEYGSVLEKTWSPVGAKELTQEYYISQLVATLNNRGVSDIEILNAECLASKMSDDISSGTASRKGLVILSGALPDTIYKGAGAPADTVFDWISDGGSLYWAGNALGKYYATPGKKTVEVQAPVYEGLFFRGVPCLTDSTETELSDVDNGYRYSLSLMNNSVRYGVNGPMLAGAGNKILSVGYTDGEHSSAVMFEFGKGMICVLAGDHSNNQRHDLAQIIASGICHSTSETAAGYAEGEVKHGTVAGTIDTGFAAGSNYTVYIYFGGYFTVYGKVTEVIR